MHIFGTYILWALAACILGQGSLAEDLRSSLLEVEAKLEGRLEEMQNMLESKLHALQVQVDRVYFSLEISQHDVQLRLEDQLQAALNQIKNQLLAVSNKSGQKDLAVNNTLPIGFERIGTRYFRISSEHVDWVTAERKCRQMGGYLASFLSREEFNIVKAKLSPWRIYWLGLNDRDVESQYVSVASHQPAKFLNFLIRDLMDHEHIRNCVSLFNGNMLEMDCSDLYSFICQADNEV